MTVKTHQNLLKNKKVVEEINRHRWIESERAGFDIGFERASTDWLERFSKAWMEYHMPKRKFPSVTSSRSPSGKRSSRKASPKTKRQTKSRIKRS